MNLGIKIAVIIENKNKKVLLLKEKLSEESLAKWNVVKGTLKENESVFEAAKRECLEETSCNVILKNTYNVYISQTSDRTRIQFNFLAESTNSEFQLPSKQEQLLNEEYIEELHWFTRSELENLEKKDFVTHRSYQLVQDYLTEAPHPITCFKNVQM